MNGRQALIPGPGSTFLPTRRGRYGVGVIGIRKGILVGQRSSVAGLPRSVWRVCILERLDLTILDSRASLSLGKERSYGKNIAT